MTRRKHRKLMSPVGYRHPHEYIYLMFMGEDGAKVGKTASPPKRAYQHVQAFDVKHLHFYAPLPKTTAHGVERHLVEVMSQFGSRIGRTEMFSEVKHDKSLIRHLRERMNSYLKAMEEGRRRMERETALWKAAKARRLASSG